jgi:carbohydrate diacid regulator
VHYEEKYDKALFIKNTISDNTLLGDLYVRAKELHISVQVPRGVFLIRQIDKIDPSAIEVVQSLFPDKQKDFVFSISETDIG